VVARRDREDLVKAMLLVHGLDVGGAETMIARLAQYLRRCGDTVEIGCLGTLGTLGEELRREGIDVVVHERRAGFDTTLAWRIARRVRRRQTDVVHLHQRPAFFYGVLAGLLHRTPIVYTEHGPLLAPPRPAQRTFNRALAWRVARITAVSRDIAHDFATLEGFQGYAVAVVPNAVDVERFTPAPAGGRESARRRLGLSLSAPILASVGRLVAVKNQVALVRVVARLRRRFADAALVLIGDGDEATTLAAVARDLGVGDAVHFVGTRRDVEELLPAFDVFCLPSVSEGIPLSLLEAMAAGVPVVAAATGGIPEAARAGEDALLVDGQPTGDDYADRFAAAVERLLLDRDCAQRLAASARRRVCDEFTIDSICRRYRDLLADASRGQLWAARRRRRGGCGAGEME
jgi:glycosyltransferase involved in cell wall biosynthesis